ncbi:MAG: hypothetical protein U5M50_01960, partial [Sphingobium sp.]|nr:hypothetical protein [Sphingobium sp.]
SYVLVGVTGGDAIAVEIGYMSLTLENRGTINGWTGTSIPADDVFGQEAQYFAGAIHTLGTASDVIVNHGVINGSIHLGDGDDRIENYGTIAGDVLLGNGNDSSSSGLAA